MSAKRGRPVHDGRDLAHRVACGYDFLLADDPNPKSAAEIERVPLGDLTDAIKRGQLWLVKTEEG